MAAGKIFAISFAINASLGASFSTAMNQGASVMKKLGDETKFLNAEQKRLDDLWKASQKELRGYSDQMQKLRSQFERGKISESTYQMGITQLSQKMRAAGMSVEEYRGHLQRLQGELERTRAATQRMQEAQAARVTAGANFAAARNGLISAVTTVGMLSAPLIGMTQTAMTFEAAMSRVQAISNATAEDTARLTAKARELGETTRFTATQSAEAMTYLGMAGWKTEQILAGMGPMLSLAAAGGTDLARTADILSDDLTAFGLTAEDAAHMADVFAYTVTNSNTTVELMGETMKYAAPVAKAFGATMEETAALTGLMANAGIKGSQAGTSLRQGFLRLAGPPKKAAKELEALGINLSDAQREMEETQATLAAYGIKLDESLPPQQKMVSVLRQLADGTSGLKDEQKLAALQAIFGTTAASGWLNVINAGPEALDQFVQALNNCDGTADRMAGTMENNAQGAATRLRSAMESLSISIGSALLPGIAAAAGKAAEFAGGLARWAGENQGLVQTIEAVAAALGASYVGYHVYNTLSAGVEVLTSNYRLLNETLRNTDAGQKILSAAADAANSAKTSLRSVFNADMWKAWSDGAVNAFNRVRAITWADVGTGIKNGVKSGTTAAAQYLTALKASAISTAGSIKASIMGLPGLISQKASAISAAFGNMGGAAMAQMKAFSLKGMFASMASGMSAMLSAVFSPMGIAIMAIAGAAYLLYKNWDKVGPFFMELWGRIQKALSDAWATMQPAIAALQTALWNLWTVVGQQLVSAWQAIQTAMEENSGTIDLLMTAFGTVAQFLGGAVVGAFIVAANVMAGVITTAVGIISGVITSLIGVMTGIIEFITGAFAGDWSRAWEGIVKIFESIFGGIKKFADSILNGVSSTVNGIVSGVSGLLSLGGANGGEPISENATGGIYRKGAFLTTFAEDGPEAAIPLDGSRRALGLWQKAGEILGVGRDSEPSINIGRPAAIPTVSAPPINISLTINGNTEPEGVRRAVLDAATEAQASFEDMMERFMHERGRLSFA